MSETDTKKENALRTLFQTASGLAIAALIFTSAAAVMLVMTYAQMKQSDPVDHPVIETLVKRYEQNPKDENLAEAIRVLDYNSRKAYFLYNTRVQKGRILVVIGLVVCVAGFGVAVYLNRKLPHPEPCGGLGENEFIQARISRKLIISVSLLSVAVSVILLYVIPAATLEYTEPAPVGNGTGKQTDETPEKPEGNGISDPGKSESAKAGEYASNEEMAKNWPCFRGFGGIGITSDRNPPVTFDIAAGKNVKWKIEDPMPSFSSPIVWGNKVFITGADESVRKILCLNADTGELLWEHDCSDIEGTPEEPPDVFDETGFAAPTMATDGFRLYAIFATGDLVCCDMEGKRLWGFSMGIPENHYGHSTSLITYKHLLIVQFDHSGEAYVTALNSLTGDSVWETARDMISWSSPSIVKEGDVSVLLLNSMDDIRGYNADTGKELWKNQCFQEMGEVGTSPAVWDGIAYVGNDMTPVTAVNIKDGTNLWSVEPDYMIPDASSPLATEKNLYLFSSNATATCVNKKDGSMKYEQEMDQGFYSSPILVGKNIFVFDRAGVMFVIEDGDVYKELGKSAVGEKVDSTPAFVGNRIYVRSIEHIYCFEKQ